ncbi:probable plastid-lipid-associated protein 14, chloroplastic isoform X2 [Actinidia eriantha]|uniref:probable plastid-lipid-associated protein 14, chloroplastic isoform X2 n=1 Tax=Actinidia eriantha TaxID=165200 RepID=UPI00258286DA|nr:probable plastid-lipid-associated protein 14, chloroplastic isoform X2 [Actinidia eriantha]
MSLCGIGWCPSWEGVEVPILSSNSSTRLIRPNSFPLMGECDSSRQKLCSRIRCSLSIKNATSLGSEEVADDTTSASLEEELGHVMKFKMSDFKICDRVSIGLSGRTDEIVFEALVKDVHSPLHNSRVVLRQLSSTQAQRRGKRAIEVLKKLARRRLMYHSYSMQVHGYVDPSTSGDYGSFTLVHGYHGSFSLRHWLQQSDWLPTLEATLALDEESVRRVGDDTVGGSAVSRQLRLVRLLMRDLLIGVNYLHSHGLAHTELRLENVHVSPVDRHIKVGILGNAADFYDNNPNTSTTDGSMDRRQMMIAFDMRCVGFMMAKMVLQELMEPLIFTKFKSFLTKILNRNWGAGWNLLSLLLAAKPSERISCLDALRHPFLCGPRWRVDPSMDIIRWGLGSTAVRITEEYIYGHQQRSRLAHFIELMEMLNPHSKPKNWMALLPGKWRLLYSTGRHIGLTLRQPPARVLIGDVHLTMSRTPKSNTTLSFTSDISFTVLIGQDWPHDKAGVVGKLGIDSSFRLTAGKRLYLKEGKDTTFLPSSSNTEDSIVKKLSGKRWRKALPFKEFPSSLPVAKLISSEVEVTMSLNDPLGKNVDAAKNAVHEVRTQVPPEMFDLSKLVCGTYVDARLLVLRGVSGSALLFTRSCANGSCRC